MVTPRAERWTTRIGRWLLGALLPSSVLAIGSLLPSVLIVMATLAAVACALLWIEPPERVARAAKWLAIAWALLVGFTILQVVPLPASIVHALAPGNADIWERSLSAFHEPSPLWHPISVAPAATRLEVLRGAFYGCVFFAALRVASERHGTTFLEGVLMVSGALLALVSLGHAAVDAKTVFGVYRPREIYAYAPGRYGPLLNVNQLTAYLNAGACVAMGAALRRRPSFPRPLLIAAAVLLAGTSVWGASRGGTGALMLGILLTVGLSIYARSKFSTARAEIAIPIVLVFAAAAIAGLGFSEEARQDLASRDVSKVGAAVNALALVPRSPFFGWGRGAFEGIFPSVRQSVEYVTFTNPENILVQWSSEWGLPVSVLAAAVILYALRPGTMLNAARPAVGAWVAIVVVVVHDLVDFHLEVPGVMAVIATTGAIVVGARAQSTGATGARGEATGGRLRYVAFAATALTIPAAIAVAPNVDHLLSDERARLSAHSQDSTVSEEQFRKELRDSVQRYPAEGFLPLMGAVRAQTLGDGNVLPWVARALEVNPRFGRAHLVLARSLASRYRSQARLEYRLAYENDVGLREATLTEVPRLVGNADDALQLVPDGALGVPVLEHLAEAIAPRLPASAAILDDEIERRAPQSAVVARRRVAAALSDVAHGHAWCAPRDVCAQRAISAAQALVARDRTSCEAHVLLSRVRVANNEAILAFDELERAVDVVTAREECQRALVDLALETKQTRRVDIALERLVRAGCGTSKECADLYAWAGDVEDRRGRTASAISFYKRAINIDPDRVELASRVGELATSLGLLSEALDAYSTLARRYPDDPRWTTALESTQREVDRARLAPPRTP